MAGASIKRGASWAGGGDFGLWPGFQGKFILTHFRKEKIFLSEMYVDITPGIFFNYDYF